MPTRSQQLYERSQHLIPGGVNSPVRAFRSVGGNPIFVSRGLGAHIWDADDKKYVDYICSWGALVAGHAHSEVINAIKTVAENGLSFGAPTELELEMAQLLCQLVPSIEQVRLVNSGTEATMSAIRLARGFTGREKIIKFEGCYHGHVDALLVKAGSGALTFGKPSSKGIPQETSTLVLDYNDCSQLEKTFSAQGREIAAVIVEPIAGNMSLVLPSADFLGCLEKLCKTHNSLLIFDEVMTGFRVALGGAQELYAIEPDLTTLGKIIGGGMPIGAFGGRKEIMQMLAPDGPVYQAGTLSGNPVAVTAGLATLKLLQTPGFYDGLRANAQELTEGLSEAADRYGIEFSAQAVGGMFGLYFNKKIPSKFADVMLCDKKLFNRFFHGMLEEGIYFAPSAFEAGFISSAHGKQEIEKTLVAAEKVFSTLKK